jgi:hypothetical protein
LGKVPRSDPASNTLSCPDSDPPSKSDDLFKLNVSIRVKPRYFGAAITIFGVGIVAFAKLMVGRIYRR